MGMPHNDRHGTVATWPRGSIRRLPEPEARFEQVGAEFASGFREGGMFPAVLFHFSRVSADYTPGREIAKREGLISRAWDC
jgi:hypothetical protein